MGMMGGLFGLGREARGIGGAVKGVAEVFTTNKTRAMELDHAARQAALAQLAAEFRSERTWFDALIDGLNRLPRPVMAGGTIGLFAYAMTDPVGFAVRMQGLVLVPDPLWWLLGAVVSFYFGARELHHMRSRTAAAPDQVAAVMSSVRALEATRQEADAPAGEDDEEAAVGENAALAAWRQGRA